MQTQLNTTTQSAAKKYQLDTTSHINAHLNRVFIQAAFKLGREWGLTHAEHIALLRSRKEHIRRHDAEPAAWFYGPSRAEWLSARLDRGEKMTDAEIGRAFSGDEARVKDAA